MTTGGGASGLKVRVGQADDLGKLCELRRQSLPSASLLYRPDLAVERAVEVLAQFFAQRDELGDWHLLVLLEQDEIKAYLLFAVDHEHGVTHQLQAVVTDCVANHFAHLEALVLRAVRIVAAYENDYLVADLPASDKRRQLWFYRLGFRAEHQRSVKRLPPGFQGASSPEFGIRRAQNSDLGFILEVHAHNAKAYLPAGREVDQTSTEARYQLAYMMLDLEKEEGAHYLLMEQRSSGIPAGYIFLRPGLVQADTPTLYVYDVAVAPQFASRGLSKYLIGAAETLASERQMPLYGDASLAIPSLVSWHSQLGYQVDSYLYSLDCRSPESDGC